MHDVHPSACAYTAIANISRDIYTFMSRAGWLSLKMLAAFLCQECGWTSLKRAQNKCSVSPTPSTHNQTNVAYVLSCAAVLTYAAVHTEKHKNIRNKNLTLVWFDSGAMFLHIYIFKLRRSLDQGTQDKNRRTCCMTVITHSSIAILLIWLMKPNVFELRAPISKVAMLGCYRDVVNLCACGCFLFHFA